MGLIKAALGAAGAAALAAGGIGYLGLGVLGPVGWALGAGLAVKNANKREGIGTELMQKAITIAEGKKKPVAAHVRDYNDASNHLFQKLGFTAVEPSSNTLYILDTIKKSRGKK